MLNLVERITVLSPAIAIGKWFEPLNIITDLETRLNW
jgi:hypothetical protein